MKTISPHPVALLSAHRSLRTPIFYLPPSLRLAFRPVAHRCRRTRWWPSLVLVLDQQLPVRELPSLLTWPLLLQLMNLCPVPRLVSCPRKIFVLSTSLTLNSSMQRHLTSRWIWSVRRSLLLSPWPHLVLLSLLTPPSQAPFQFRRLPEFSWIKRYKCRSLRPFILICLLLSVQVPLLLLIKKQKKCHFSWGFRR